MGLFHTPYDTHQYCYLVNIFRTNKEYSPKQNEDRKAKNRKYFSRY